MLAPMKKICLTVSLCGALTVFAGGKLMAADANALSTGYGWFNTLDQRSGYGQGVFPEPFLVDDSDLETGEARLDYLRTAVGGDHAEVTKAEIEKNWGLTTFELEVPYERDVAGGVTTKGFDNIDVGARHPLLQFVSPNGLVDSTVGAGVELGVPTTSDVSHNTELVPKIFDDLKRGNFTLQSVFGCSMLFGPGEDGGLNTFEYGFVFGWDIPRKILPLPGVLKVIPVAELSGETALNHASAGQNSLTADAGLRLNLKTIWGIQPRPGVVFVFPVDNGARQDAHWGVMASFVFEF
jgi:hypothetical protein